MGKPIINIESVSKVYRLGSIGTGTLSHDLKRWWTINVLKKEDPYLKIDKSENIQSKGKGLLWALKDINMQVEKGEVLGIIGKNGAGKSTLLKILSRVTRPTEGTIKYQGTMASLLEVGTGFHPEMTGRENIFMNGTIMGMSRVEIKRKLDEIVSFAGVEKFVDTPVKRYSSGMTVRLGFSIAAHLEPDILIVDEVLAVGDAEFQQKAIGKMQDVSQQHGRTVLFVSHNLAAVKALCSKGVVLSSGQITFEGGSSEACNYYQNLKIRPIKTWSDSSKIGNSNIEVNKIDVFSGQENSLSIDSPFSISIDFRCHLEKKSLGMSVFVVNQDEVLMFESYGQISRRDSRLADYNITFSFPAFIMNSGTYQVVLLFAEQQQDIILNTGPVMSFEIENVAQNEFSYSKTPGVIKPPYTSKVTINDY